MLLRCPTFTFPLPFVIAKRRLRWRRAAIGGTPIVSTSKEVISVPDRMLLKSSVVPAPFQELPQQSISVPITPPLAYEMVQGALVRHCDVTSVQPPTIVMVHGILGSKKNLRNFAKRLVEDYPSWQAILVDLRCHGDSYSQNTTENEGDNNVESAARDILQLLNYLKLFPRVLIGHSFGGKVVMSMAHQFGQTLPRPVQAWVLDTIPGKISVEDSDRSNNPLDLIQTLQNIPLPIVSRSSLVQKLISNGFSSSVANWMTTNLKTVSTGGFVWAFDLEGIEQLYRSYETSSLWPLLTSPPEGLRIDFIRAEYSHFQWPDHLLDQIHSLGHRVHVLKNAGHWVHADNPEGLYHILQQSLGADSSRTQLPSFYQ